MKAAIDYKEANSALIGVDTFEGILGYIVATVISNKNIQAHERSGNIYELIWLYGSIA